MPRTLTGETPEADDRERGKQQQQNKTLKGHNSHKLSNGTALCIDCARLHVKSARAPHSGIYHW